MSLLLAYRFAPPTPRLAAGRAALANAECVERLALAAAGGNASSRPTPRRGRFGLIMPLRLVPAIGGDDGHDDERAGQGEEHGGGGLEDQHGFPSRARA